MVVLEAIGPSREPESLEGVRAVISGGSSETKPINVLEGSLFIESDTGKIFIFNQNGQTWTEL